MGKFAPVAPVQVLEGLYGYSDQTFGSYHLLLAHHTVDEEDRFRALFRRIHNETPTLNPTIIMDNSLVELGGAVDFQMLSDAVEVITEVCEEATVIPVLPDVMGDGAETRRAVEDAYDRWSEFMPGNGFMAVCQGASWDDFQESVDMFADQDAFPEITWLGIPRKLVETLGTRKDAVAYALAASNGRHEIHLLGFSDNMVDDYACAKLPGVAGIDSAVPLRVESQFTLDMKVPPRPPEWFDEAECSPRVIANLNRARLLLEGAE